MAISIDQLGLDDGDQLATLLRRFYPLLIERAFEDAQTVLGVDLFFDLDNAAVQDVLDDLALLVKDIAETTRADVQALLGQQAAEGWSVEELAKRLRERGVTESVRRSELISATEVARSYSKGSLLAYQQSGVVGKVEWLTASSEVCDICEPLNGKQVALGDTFDGGIDGPPAHPNCRCAILPIVGV